jgi:class 3 adenylate cyclase/HAMP domain-containing protein
MKLFSFKLHSIRTRVMVFTALLIVSLVWSIVWLWVTNERDFYQQEQREQAQSVGLVLAQSLQIELGEQNWGNLRTRLEILMKYNPDVIYGMITDVHLNNKIVAATPYYLEEKYIPDIVPLYSSKIALQAGQPRLHEAFLLHDIVFQSTQLRGKKGEKVIEIATDIPYSSDNNKTAGILRVGITLQHLNNALKQAVIKGIIIGIVGLVIGLIGAYILAKKLTNPILNLQNSAAKIAAGNLKHRAEIHLRDEIGDLAQSFNDMSISLQNSFDRLQKTLESFVRFVPNKFLAVIAPRGIENISVGEFLTKKITILFCDIRNYTTMSENMPTEELFYFLNDYLACMGKPIEENGGFIDKYIGDAIMALFDDQSTDRSVLAALAMQKCLIEFNQRRKAKGLPAIAVGIGLHYGEVIMGTVGFTSRIDSTVIGDAVNIASRVEGLTKQYQADILITDSIVKNLENPQQFNLQEVDKGVKVKGKEALIDLYKVT